MRLQFRLFGRTIKLYFYSYKEQHTYVAGITNKCRDGRYVIFLDYDEVPREWVEEELKYLCDEHFLKNIHLFRTNNGYHAICTEKVSLRTLVKIMRDSSTDAAYLTVPLRRAKKVWTLRTTPKGGEKPRYIKTIKGDGCVMGCETSSPHDRILEKLYNIKPPTGSGDGEKTFWTGHYHIEA